MQCRISELRCKEVVNICDGQRLGCVKDVLLDVSCGRIAALVLPGPCRFLGLFASGEDVLIRWECVKRIGDDLILVEKQVEAEQCRKPNRFRF